VVVAVPPPSRPNPISDATGSSCGRRSSGDGEAKKTSAPDLNSRGAVSPPPGPSPPRPSATTARATVEMAAYPEAPAQPVHPNARFVGTGSALAALAAAGFPGTAAATLLALSFFY
jgi:hypothetical protein